MFLETSAAHLDVIHARTAEQRPIPILQSSEPGRHVALHLGRRRCRPERHAQPLIESAGCADHQHLLCWLVDQELGIAPDGVNDTVVTLARSQVERPFRVSRRKARDLHGCIHHSIGTHEPAQEPFRILVDHKHGSRPLGKRLLVRIDLPQFPFVDELFNVILDSKLVERRQCDRLPCHRLRSVLQTKPDQLVLDRGWIASLQPEALGVRSHDFFEEASPLFIGPSDEVCAHPSHFSLVLRAEAPLTTPGETLPALRPLLRNFLLQLREQLRIPFRLVSCFVALMGAFASLNHCVPFEARWLDTWEPEILQLLLLKHRQFPGSIAREEHHRKPAPLELQ